MGPGAGVWPADCPGQEASTTKHLRDHMPRPLLSGHPQDRGLGPPSGSEGGCCSSAAARAGAWWLLPGAPVSGGPSSPALHGAVGPTAAETEGHTLQPKHSS